VTSRSDAGPRAHADQDRVQQLVQSCTWWSGVLASASEIGGTAGPDGADGGVPLPARRQCCSGRRERDRPPDGHPTAATAILIAVLDQFTFTFAEASPSFLAGYTAMGGAFGFRLDPGAASCRKEMVAGVWRMSHLGEHTPNMVRHPTGAHPSEAPGAVRRYPGFERMDRGSTA